MKPLDDLAADWLRLTALLDEALALPPPQRAGWLRALPAEHAPLKDPLARLLAAQAEIETGEFLGTLPKLGGAALPPPGTADPGASQAGDEVGPYRLLSELGQGGMGSVWLAERGDGHLNRRVALKLPRLSWAQGLAERMARERDILATLEHPNIARLYDAGVDRLGRPWLALEVVEGRPIDVHAGERTLTVRQRVALLLQVCDAVAYAHRRLVIHRDLKPGNILVTDDGQVKLLDFGIAKLMQGDATAVGTALTELAGRALTLDYASPEQVRGEPLSTASDVYSLGVVAYEVLAGARPYRLKRGSAAELEEAITLADPPASSRAAGNPLDRRTLRGDLDAILNRALKKPPAERYGTVDALAEDLRRWLDGLPVSARPDGWGYRCRKFVRRHRAAVALGTAATLAVVVAAGVVVAQGVEARQQAERARQVQQFVVSIFADANPDGAGRGDVSALTLLQQAGRRLDGGALATAELEADLRGALGRSLGSLGAHEEAEAVWRRVAERSRLAFGADDPRTLDAELAQQEAALLADRLPETAAWLQQLLDGGRLADRPAQRAEALRLLSLALQRGSEPRQALAPAREALRLAAGHGLADPRLRSRLHAQLASAMSFLNERGAAAEASAALAALREAEGDAEGGAQLQLRMLLAMALGIESRYEEAVREADTVVQRVRAIYGPRHFALGNALNFAGTARSVRDRDAALRDFAQAQAIFDAAGQPTQDGATNAVAFAADLLNADRHDEALQVARAGLAQAREVFAPGHGVTAALKRAELLALARLGRLADAAAALPAIEADGRDRPRRWPSVLAMRAELRLLQGRLAEAEQDAREAVARLDDGSSNDSVLWRARLLLAQVLAAQRRWQEAGAAAAAAEGEIERHDARTLRPPLRALQAQIEAGRRAGPARPAAPPRGAVSAAPAASARPAPAAPAAR